MTDPRFPIPIDPELLPALEMMSAGPRAFTRETLRAPAAPPQPVERLHGNTEEQSAPAFVMPSLEELIGGRAIVAEHRSIPGPAGAPDLPAIILRPASIAADPGAGPGVPVLYNIHGGGMIIGAKEMDNSRLIELVDELGVIAVNVDYRLAPEHPYPAGSDDVYAGFLWTAANAAALGGDPARIVVMGGSAGGGFSAIVAQRQRDEQGPALAGQLLLCPMVDNTSSTFSAGQYADPALAVWTLEANRFAWDCVLGADLAESTAAPAHAAPSRAESLAGLAPAFIEVGAAEMFRDEDIEYANRIWATGGACELHVWAGAYHGFDVFGGDSEVTRAAKASRVSWLRRVLGL